MAHWIVKEKAAGYTEEMLLSAVSGCYSYENHAAHGFDSLSADYVGTLYAEGFPDRLYVMYQDKGGSYWYKSCVDTGHGTVELYEHVFGRKEGRPDRRRRVEH